MEKKHDFREKISPIFLFDLYLVLIVRKVEEFIYLARKRIERFFNLLLQ